ncbi:Alpha/Beta hydrolase protein, partial [Dactylonectria macrodidyma]
TSVFNRLALLSTKKLTSVDVSGDYNLTVRFCEPEVRIFPQNEEVQILVSGLSYDRTYWSALDTLGQDSVLYSWTSYASRRGYATLSIDRLGMGSSSHPDPLNVVQVPLQAAIFDKIAKKLRTGKIGGRCFRKVHFVGHSLGSIIGNYVAASFPKTIDSLVLTGYGREIELGGAALMQPIPAARFAALSLPTSSPQYAALSGLANGYLVTSSKSGRGQALYGVAGTYDKSVLDVDWAQMTTFTVGELLTMSPVVARKFTRPVLVVTGEQDTVFCFDNSTGGGACGQGPTTLPARATELFPRASNFSYFIPANLGHDVNLHYRAAVVFEHTHDWL